MRCASRLLVSMRDAAGRGLCGGMVGGVSEMDSMRDWLGEMFGQVGERFDRMDERFDRFEARVDARFDQVDERFDRLEARVDEIAAVNGTLIDEVARINHRLG